MLKDFSQHLEGNYLPAAGVGFILFIWTLSFFVERKRKRLPPGPRGWPIVGNLLDIPKSHAWHRFEEWSRQYGDVCYVNLAGQDMVLLGSHKAASDLLDKRSSIYSGRPANHIISDLLLGGLSYPFLSTDGLWKKARRVSHEALKIQVAPQFRPLQLSEARLTVEYILNSPDDVNKHLIHSNASFGLRSIFGTPTLKADDYRIERIIEIVDRIAEAGVPGAFLVEFFTWMQYLPNILAPWRVWAKQCSKKDGEFLEKLYSDAEVRMKNGQQHPSVASSFIEDGSESLTAREKAWTLASNIFAADTMSTTLIWFVWAMGRFPDVQVKAQKELDKVVGRERMPDFNDFEALPFIRATIMELLRWTPVVPIGMAHTVMRDDMYGEYLIPKGTMCIQNIHMMNRDPTVYGDDADSFNPSRFIDSATGQLRPSLPLTHDESHVAYGFGRRICVGRAVANQGLFINAASLLWAFKFEDPSRISTSPAFGPNDYVDNSLLLKPTPFKYKIEPRFSEVHTIVMQSEHS
ncbi:cytochrome P450 [Flagelloscypha sp. PMI_526]|nr:cytochrome P450 [Flagelloscypha sp. PMI_526]